ncbi:MAG TPA: PSD1 and planctomycete cytochrome C domain-containing protein [Methylomirabilota bacterium]|nr:PSD1 and planctomycete cytochrome C domain-containing protein [Methylomirabilota bacterium]
MRRHPIKIIVAVAASSVLAAQAAGPAISFNRDIRPILSDNCFVCHGADKSSRKAKLRLDIREVALEKEAFIPGKPDDSELIKRIFTTNEDDLMPPLDSHKTLTVAQKNLLKQWVAEGAKYEPHWSFIAPARPEVPKVNRSVISESAISKAVAPQPGRGAPNADSLITPPNPIDAFILAELQKRGVKPSPEADRRTLLRRLSLDLTGLPPTPGELAAFEKDKSSRAYEKQVDRLLASPHFGERMAVPWLDVVRFADTVGYHGDQNVNVFPYRDYVINSFNKNKPFDQFTIEQLAGDLLPNNTAEQRIATGFNRLNMVTREGGAQPQEYLAKYGADRVRTVGMAWLGLTVGCAECHDHKFDPFTTKDFYQLKAIFADVRQWGVYNDYKYTPNPDLKNWSNDHPFPPEEVVESAYLRRRVETLRSEMGRLADRTAEKRPSDVKAWSKSVRNALADSPDNWLVPQPIVAALTNVTIVTNRTKLTNIVVATENAAARTNIANRTTFKTNAAITTNFMAQADGSLLFSTRPDNNPISVKLNGGTIAALRLELLPHAKHGGGVFRGNRTAANIQFSASLQRAGEKKETKVAFYHADADHKEPRYANGFEIIGIKDTWKVSREHGKEKQTGVWLLDPPLQVKDGDTLTLQLKTNIIGSLRVSVSPVVPTARSWDNETPIALIDPRLLVTPAARNQAWLTSTAADAEAFAAYKKLHRELLECRGGKSPTVVTVAWKPDTTRVLPRGNWQSEDGEIVQPLPPHFLPQPKVSGAKGLTRLEFAKWLVSPENPLTARTVVNRFWKQFFGSGLSNPVDDLGLQGESPSHPELLDWLAVEFMQPGVNVPSASRRVGWDVQHIVRLIVTSSTYKQSSKLRPELRDIDPNNRLLTSQNPRRLEAEFVRDNALKIAALLNPEIGGPSAHPYQPGGYYVNLQFPDRDYHASKDERQYRRGVYAHWQRTFLQPMLANFDAPSREECAAIRTASNTPQQALTLLNDPTFVEAARVLAQKVLQSPAKSDEARLNLAYERSLGRSAKPSELASLKKFLVAQRNHLRSEPDEPVKIQKVGIAPTAEMDAVELGAWTSVCRVILNLHEVITIY